ncbi:MAG: hypothetical protein RJQ00_03285 [Vicingaceae bacterium]
MKNKIRSIILLCIVLSFSSEVKAQPEEKSGLGFGFQLNQYQNDFGLGVNLSSPNFFNESMCIRLRANAMFNEYVNDEFKTDWEPYANIMLGFSSASYKISDAIALYGEGGVIGIFPASKISSSDLDIGGYGIFGFEFYFYDGFCYFIEAGGIGTGATADKLPAEPIYSNGFLMSVGLKVKL